jgi:hypothetical protein
VPRWTPGRHETCCPCRRDITGRRVKALLDCPRHGSSDSVWRAVPRCVRDAGMIAGLSPVDRSPAGLTHGRPRQRVATVLASVDHQEALPSRLGRTPRQRCQAKPPLAAYVHEPSRMRAR